MPFQVHLKGVRRGKRYTGFGTDLPLPQLPGQSPQLPGQSVLWRLGAGWAWADCHAPEGRAPSTLPAGVSSALWLPLSREVANVRPRRNCSVATAHPWGLSVRVLGEAARMFKEPAFPCFLACSACQTSPLAVWWPVCSRAVEGVWGLGESVLCCPVPFPSR